MKYQARNRYNDTDTCGHLHRSEKRAEQCCNRMFAHNVGHVATIYEDYELEAMRDAHLIMERKDAGYV